MKKSTMVALGCGAGAPGSFAPQNYGSWQSQRPALAIHFWKRKQTGGTVACGVLGGCAAAVAAGCAVLFSARKKEVPLLEYQGAPLLTKLGDTRLAESAGNPSKVQQNGSCIWKEYMMKIHTIKILFITLLLPLYCVHGQEGIELTSSKSTEQELADIVSSIRKNLEGTTVLHDFDKEQQAWEVYRELHMRTLFPESINEIRMLWGSILSHDAAAELDKINEDRIKTLERYMKGSHGTGTDGRGIFKEYLEEVMLIQ